MAKITGVGGVFFKSTGNSAAPAAWYRKLFAKAGLTAAGPYTWLAPSLRDDAAALEAMR